MNKSKQTMLTRYQPRRGSPSSPPAVNQVEALSPEVEGVTYYYAVSIQPDGTTETRRRHGNTVEVVRSKP